MMALGFFSINLLTLFSAWFCPSASLSTMPISVLENVERLMRRERNEGDEHRVKHKQVAGAVVFHPPWCWLPGGSPRCLSWWHDRRTVSPNLAVTILRCRHGLGCGRA